MVRKAFSCRKSRVRQKGNDFAAVIISGGASAYLVMLGGAMILVFVALAAVRRHIPPVAKPPVAKPPVAKPQAGAVAIPASDPQRS
jgi:MFS transporter, AAHS family, 4-hydroxybenzoate transporter